ncbi:signal recognition particle 9 kDa protein-domain-containing protein [Limtongia smithiae]|uniref:signal recognition particle 9 kDa protein-domain-containing protein n=1 Tax=Limtongia smithiae TaxID=1125753 RepID=UPI0034CD1BB9
MPALGSATVFIHQSTLLLQARPTTARVSYSYNMHKSTKRAMFSAKCYDPISGACFRFKTHKANELNRILRALLGFGTQQAGLSNGTDVGAVIE